LEAGVWREFLNRDWKREYGESFEIEIGWREFLNVDWKREYGESFKIEVG